MANPNPCGVTRPYKPGMKWICRRKADHVLHPGKYTRQHMDNKNSPAIYWDATDEDIANYKAKLTTK